MYFDFFFKKTNTNVDSKVTLTTERVEKYVESDVNTSRMYGFGFFLLFFWLFLVFYEKFPKIE
jgi:hypothetical protein